MKIPKVLYRFLVFIWCWTPMGVEISIQADILQALERIEEKIK